MTVADSGGASLAPVVVEGEVIACRPVWRSPLDGHTTLTGGVVSGRREVRAIAARVAYYRLPVWRRVWRRRPTTAAPAPPPAMIDMPSPGQVAA